MSKPVRILQFTPPSKPMPSPSGSDVNLVQNAIADDTLLELDELITLEEEDEEEDEETTLEEELVAALEQAPATTP